MPDYYFMSGYTGFCPNLSEKIGQTYYNSTREVFRDRPQMRSRLGGVHWREAQTGDVALRSGNAFECAYIPEIPSCNRDDSTGRCPLKAHPLACTQFGSPCLDKCCSNECGDQRSRNQGDAEFLVCENEADSRHFKECHPCLKPEVVCYPASCSQGGPCGEGLSCCVQLPKPKTRPVLPNCNPCVKDPNEVKRPPEAECYPANKGGPCGEDLTFCVQQPKPKPRPLPNCNPCVKDPIEVERPSVTSGREVCDCCCSKFDTDCEKTMIPPPCFQSNYRNYKMRPYRKCGVIPNYMGYIPGMLMTFGETYGITANRLLKRHFNEQSKMCYQRN